MPSLFADFQDRAHSHFTVHRQKAHLPRDAHAADASPAKSCD